MKLWFIGGVLLINISTLFSRDVSTILVASEATTKLKSFNCYVTMIEDRGGAKYIVKQYKHGSFSLKVATVVCELVALDMGHAVGVRLNTIYPLPAGMSFEGKETSLPATLHEFVEGVRFDHCEIDRFRTISLQQCIDTGLTRQIIQSMAGHTDLPSMIALDTFVGNIDRGRYNYFYNVRTDTFTGIDLGGAFACNISEASLATIAALDDGSDISREELVALQHYYETLQKLIEHYPPWRICEKIDEYSSRIRIFDAQLFAPRVQKKWKHFLERCKRNIQCSYVSTCKLADALECLFKKRGLG